MYVFLLRSDFQPTLEDVFPIRMASEIFLVNLVRFKVWCVKKHGKGGCGTLGTILYIRVGVDMVSFCKQTQILWKLVLLYYSYCDLHICI